MRIHHIIDEVCDCKNCTKIDMLIGDPLLNTWEKDFVVSVAGYGWIADYSKKQIAALDRIWLKIHRLRKLPIPKCS